MRFLAPMLALPLAACGASIPIGTPYVPLRATEWRVAAVNGQPTPAGDYWLRFGPRREFGARFGCNHMGGTYQSLGGTLLVSDLSQTLMGCPEPAATFERQGSAILGARAKVDWADGGRAVLRNAAGTMTLERVR